MILIRTPIKAMRQYCLECGDGTYKEVRLCRMNTCPLYPYRFGRRPKEEEIKELERELKNNG